jgi:hypothetical protein
MGQIPVTYHFDGSGLGVNAGPSTRRMISATYDATVQGGGTASYPIARLNKGARIIGGFIDMLATATAVSGTPTISVGVNTAADLFAATSVLGAPFSTNADSLIIPRIETQATTSVAVTADSNVVVAVAAAAISTGRFTVYLDVIG